MNLRLPRFRHLSTKLAVLYAGLFGTAMLCASLVLFAVVERNATHQVDDELTASSTVFDRLWEQRTAQLGGAAQLLARDFGFRAAVATGDGATIRSALLNTAPATGRADRLRHTRRCFGGGARRQGRGGRRGAVAGARRGADDRRGRAGRRRAPRNRRADPRPQSDRLGGVRHRPRHQGDAGAAAALLDPARRRGVPAAAAGQMARRRQRRPREPGAFHVHRPRRARRPPRRILRARGHLGRARQAAAGDGGGRPKACCCCAIRSISRLPAIASCKWRS